jgi:hypothetical protein
MHFVQNLSYCLAPYATAARTKTHAFILIKIIWHFVSSVYLCFSYDFEINREFSIHNLNNRSNRIMELVRVYC